MPEKEYEDEVMAKRLTPEERAAVLAEYALCGNYSAVGRKFGVSNNAVKKIVKSEPQSVEKFKQKKTELELSMLEYLEKRTAKAQSVVDKLLDAMEDKRKLDRANIRDTATALGIVIDKFTGIGNKADNAAISKLDELMREIKNAAADR